MPGLIATRLLRVPPMLCLLAPFAHAAEVRQMFHWLVDEQLSTYQIVKRLNESGHRTRRGNARWAGGTVYNILRNAVYAGRYCYNGRIQQPAQRKNMPVDQPRKHGPHSRTLRPPEEWITVAVPAIIELELWEQAQQQRTRAAQ